MNGGSISGNTAGSGGGVYNAYATFNGSGKAGVTGNTPNDVVEE